MKNYILILLLSFNLCIAQQKEKYQVYIIKITKLENGIKEQKDIFIDTLAKVKNSINKNTFEINSEKFNESIYDFLSNVKFEKHEADNYNNRELLISNLTGENINIYITKLSDLKKVTKTNNKTYYSYYKFYPISEDNEKRKNEYEIEKFLNLTEFKKLIELLQ